MWERYLQSPTMRDTFVSFSTQMIASWKAQSRIACSSRQKSAVLAVGCLWYWYAWSDWIHYCQYKPANIQIISTGYKLSHNPTTFEYWPCVQLSELGCLVWICPYVQPGGQIQLWFRAFGPPQAPNFWAPHTTRIQLPTDFLVVSQTISLKHFYYQ